MAHQCLQCGSVYEEGSPELLKGCADCGGTRFFFTQAPLSDRARGEIREKANEDLRSIVRDLLEEGVKPDYDDDLWSLASRRQWLALDPKDAGKTVREYVEEVADRERASAKARSGGAAAAGAPDDAGDAADAGDADEAMEELEALVERGGKQPVIDSLDIEFVTGDADAPDDGDEAVVEIDPFIDPEVPDRDDAPTSPAGPGTPDTPAPQGPETVPEPAPPAEPQPAAEPDRSPGPSPAPAPAPAPAATEPAAREGGDEDLPLDVEVGPGADTEAERARAHAAAADAADAEDQAAVTPPPAPEELWVDEDGEEREGRPEVVTVKEPGTYEIDVEALLGDSPIIVQNDGTYLVHLPSLFHSRALKKN